MVNTHTAKRQGSVSFFVLCFVSFVFSQQCWAQNPARASVTTTPSQKLAMTARKSMTLESQTPVKRVSLADEAIASAMVLTPQQIYLVGKIPGVTNLTLWDDQDRVTAVFDIEVLPDINSLKERLYEMFPQEENIRVTATHDSLTLSGTVSSTAVLSQVLEIANGYAPGEKECRKVNNLLEVGGVHQVMLEVRVSEMSRTLIKRLGVNFSYLTDGGNGFGVSILDNLARVPPGASGAGSVFGTTDNINLIFRFLGGGATWTLFVDALNEQGLLRILAKPTLITLSGRSAYFLAGGEFPVPVPQAGTLGVPVITIEWKPFGVGLNFTPTVLNNKKISMEVAPEVSELDFSNALRLQGFVIPALTTRRVSTVVELADGQSFAIAGLLNDEYRQTLRKYPLLGDIPILGVLFRSNNFKKSETELIVIVTPRLVKPLDKTKQTLPTDKYVEPNDFEFYLLGRLEGKKKPLGPDSSLPDDKGGLEGDFGHVTP